MTGTELSQTFLLDWQAAEIAAVEHMRSLGFIDAQTTKSGADGGIDVQSSDAAAQVKFYANPVGRPDVQKLRGAAQEYRISIFYSTGGYTNEAVNYADQAVVALFKMDPYGNAEPVSKFAALLVESEYVQERKEKLEALKEARYRHASVAFNSDLQLYAQFVSQMPLMPNESALYSYVTSALELEVEKFDSAVRVRQFEQADSAFAEIQKRIGFLGWITGSKLKEEYDSLEAASAEGWRSRVVNETDYLRNNIATGAFALRDLIVEFLKGWEEFFPEGTKLYHLQDDELRKSAGMLLSISFDEQLVSNELLADLEHDVKTGVQRTHQLAIEISTAIFNRVVGLGLPRPRDVMAGKLRTDALAARILQQLDSLTQVN